MLLDNLTRGIRCGAWLILSALVWIVFAGGAQAQIFELRSLNPLAPDSHGLRLYGVSVYSSYYSSALPLQLLSSGSNPYLTQGRSFGSDVSSGVAANLGWSWGKKSTFAIQYSFAFNGSVKHSEWNNFNHHFAFRGGRPVKITPKLTLNYGGTADMSTFQNFLFSPTQAATVAGTSMDFGDLSAALLQHEPTNNQLAAALTGSSVADSSLGSLLYGNQVLNLEAHVSLSYTFSPRLTLTTTATFNRQQPVSFGGGDSSSGASKSTDLPPYALSVNHDNAAGLGIGVSYLLTPRTTAGIMINSNRNISSLADQFVSSAAGYITTVLGRHWFISANAGSGDLARLRSVFGNNGGGIGWLAGLGIGTSFRKHTFIVMGNRNIGDSWGLGSSSSVSATAAWAWQIGRTWGIYANFTEQQLHGSIVDNVNGWRAGSGATRSLGRVLFLNMQYSYFRNFGKYSGLPYNFASSGARVSLTWVPSGTLAGTRARTPEGLGNF